MELSERGSLPILPTSPPYPSFFESAVCFSSVLQVYIFLELD